MKKIFIATGLLFLWATACKNVNQEKTSAHTQADSNRIRSQEVYKGIETGDMSAMDHFVSTDIIDYGGMREVRGLDSVKKMLGDIHNHFSNLKFVILSDATSANGEYHFALVRMTGTTKDNYMGMAANTPMDETSVDVVKWQNGKIVEHWGFENAKGMMKMMEGNKNMQPGAKMDTMMKR
ncbi:MAG TPA: ester cyclase [Daejeonella sp.]|nr:ester cyclase [Daejeonella sp.]